ncbi:hypothetical protein ACHAPJ_005904 [Fusarium lateritium]
MSRPTSIASYPVFCLNLWGISDARQCNEWQVTFNVAAFPSNIPGRYNWSFAMLDNATGNWRIYEVRKDFSGRFCALRIKDQGPEIGGNFGLMFATMAKDRLPEVYERCQQVPVPYLHSDSEADCSRQYIHDVLRHLSDAGIITSKHYAAVVNMMNQIEIQLQHQVMGLGF